MAEDGRRTNDEFEDRIRGTTEQRAAELGVSAVQLEVARTMNAFDELGRAREASNVEMQRMWGGFLGVQGARNGWPGLAEGGMQIMQGLDGGDQTLAEVGFRQVSEGVAALRGAYGTVQAIPPTADVEPEVATGAPPEYEDDLVKAELAESNVLARIGPPVQLQDGVDVLVVKDPDLVNGITVWVQNPYRAEGTLSVVIGASGDMLRVAINPLEIGRLVIPLDQTDDLGLKISSSIVTHSERTRPLEPSSVVWGKTALSLAGALGAALVMGIGRYAVHRQGGMAKQPASFSLSWSGKYQRPYQPVRYERLWAPAGSEENLLEFKKSTRSETEYRGPGIFLVWIAAGLAGLAGFFFAGILGFYLLVEPPYRDAPMWLFLVAGVVGIIVGALANVQVRSFCESRGWVLPLTKGSVLRAVDGVEWDHGKVQAAS